MYCKLGKKQTSKKKRGDAPFFYSPPGGGTERRGGLLESKEQRAMFVLAFARNTNNLDPGVKHRDDKSRKQATQHPSPRRSSWAIAPQGLCIGLLQSVRNDFRNDERGILNFEL